MEKKLTIYEMAKKARVSIATISRALNPETRSKVSPETLEKINVLFRKYQYTPNLAAKNLSKASFKTIGLLLPHHAGIFLEDYYSKILAGTADSLLASDYHLKMVMLKCQKNKWDKYNFKFGEGVDGLIVTHWHAFFSHPSAFEKINVPCIVISDPEPKTRVHFVSGDHLQGGRFAAEYLYSKGHRKIAIFTGPLCSVDSGLRVKGFQSFFLEKGISLDPELVLCGEFQEEKAYQITEVLVQKRRDITAIFCCNDNMAFGVLRKLAELRMACPDQISVLGYDDDQRASTTHPPLTTIRVPVYDLAKEAGNRLIRYLDEKDPKAFFYQETLMPVNLVERKSVKRIQ